MNPAQRLHDTLVDWKERHNGNTSLSQSRDLETAEGMRAQMLALGDLQLIEAGLDELEALKVRVATYRRNVPTWRRMVLAYPHGWTSGISPEDAYPSDPIDHLDTLADRWEDKQTSMPEERKQFLLEAVREVDSLLDADGSLSPKLRGYIRRLLREIQAAFDDEVLDERFDYEEAAQRLWVSLFAARAQSTNGERWTDTMKRFFYDAGAAALGSAPQTILAIAGATGNS
ncbi:hypothetical protein [Curtobacterium sp. MCLR17_042]|uniref:hypothetical protein n=1 Tax=Curtobacterium sp. MCLR17_042 TaxID=2175626 RepID=UPI0011B43E22|nr:hypothetical protein [Curtobacterium sp. MCLR17_042]